MWAVPLLIATHALKVVFSFCILTIQPKTFKEHNKCLHFLYLIDKQELAVILQICTEGHH
jgi:hypothetical protein